MWKPDKKRVVADAKRALEEDLGSRERNGDVSAQLIPADLEASAEIISREPMLVCGIDWVNAVFEWVNPDIRLEWKVADGDWCAEALTLCTIRGKARDILSAERSALNFLQTLSATATQTRAYVLALAHSKTKVLDTRKTIPGLRYAQKYAVQAAGGSNHRMGLYDAFLIKENHIASCGSITEAINKARQLDRQLFLEVEVENIEQLKEALKAKPDRILLDNFTKESLHSALALKEKEPSAIPFEVSGGVTLDTIKDIAEMGVDYISVGAITKSIQAIDLSLLIRKDQQA